MGVGSFFVAVGDDLNKPTFKTNDLMLRIASTLPPSASQGEPAGDRVLLTSFGSFDARRMRGVVESVQFHCWSCRRVRASWSAKPRAAGSIGWRSCSRY